VGPGTQVADRARPLRTVNLKSDLPAAQVAEERLLKEIRASSRAGHKVLKVIHGYGSTGVGGALKQRVHKVCETLIIQDTIAFYVPGEDFDRRNARGKKLLERVPELKKDPDYRRRNAGVTLIVL
jgi:hypothetical protein